MILDQFDPAKPFYSLVLTYLSQLHGLMELISVGLIQRFEKISERRAFVSLTAEERIAKYVAALELKNQPIVERVLRGGKTALMFEPVLPSVTARPIKLDIPMLAETAFLEHEAAIRDFNRISAGSLLILANERVTKHRGDPIVQFLRHCRNAAAHGGVFTFDSGEPKKPAVWRTLTIERPMQGNCLFPVPPNKGFIGIGDVLYLLADIEKKFL